MSHKGYDLIFHTVIGHHMREDLVQPVSKILQEVPITEGWDVISTKNDRILDNYVRLKKAFTDEVQSFLKDIMKYECDLQMTTSWFTKVNKNEKLHAHDHNNSWYSACFYIQKDCQLKFETRASQIYVKPTEETLYNSLGVTYNPEPGSILIFPSKTMHLILRHNWDSTRYSLAFNFMPKGQVGMHDSSYEY